MYMTRDQDAFEGEFMLWNSYNTKYLMCDISDRGWSGRWL